MQECVRPGFACNWHHSQLDTLLPAEYGGSQRQAPRSRYDFMDVEVKGDKQACRSERGSPGSRGPMLPKVAGERWGGVGVVSSLSIPQPPS